MAVSRQCLMGARHRLLCFFCLELSQCMGKLVGAAGGFHAALYAFDAVDDVLVFHTLDERGDALEVAVTASEEFYADDAAFVACETDELAAGPLCLVYDFFHECQVFYYKGCSIN